MPSDVSAVLNYPGRDRHARWGWCGHPRARVGGVGGDRTRGGVGRESVPNVRAPKPILDPIHLAKVRVGVFSVLL